MHGDVINHRVPAGSKKKKKKKKNGIAILVGVLKRFHREPVLEDVIHLNKAARHQNLPPYRSPIGLLTCALTNDGPLKML